MQTKHTPKCDCGSKHCNGEMQLNGVRFVCGGDCSLTDHSSGWAVYEAAPALLEALQGVLEVVEARVRNVELPDWQEKLQAGHAALTLATPKP